MMKYTAFISYSHASDAAVAAAVQSSLHHFAKPWYRRRAMRVFRDKTSLSASPALWPSLEAALSASEFLVLMASPQSAHSVWIQRELSWWMEHRSADTLLIVLTGGDIVWQDASADFDWDRTSALPGTLRGVLKNEPLYVDLRGASSADALSLRHSKFRDAILDLASTLRRTSKDDLDGEDVRQFRRTRRVAWTAGTVLLALTIAFGSAWWYAVRQRDLARARELSARSTLALGEGNVGLGALLAIEAVNLRTSLESDNAMRRALALLAAPVAELPFDDDVTTVVTDRAGRKVVLGGEKRLVVWDSSSGTVTPLAAKTPVSHAAFARDGRRVLVIDADGHVEVWDGTRTQPPRPPAAIHAAALSGNGQWAALVDGGGFTYLWDIERGTVRRLGGPPGGTFHERGTAVAVSDDGARVIVSGRRLLRVWAAGGMTERIPPDEWKATAVVLAGDATRVATFDSRTNLIDVWEPVSGMRMARVFVGAQAHLLSLMSADGRRIMSDEIGAGSGRYGIYVWDVETRAPVSLIHHPNVLYNHRAISGDGNRVVLFQDGRVSVWDVTQEQVLTLPPDVGGSPRPIDVSGDGARALIAGERDVRLIDATTGKALWHTNAPSERQQVRLSSDGRVVLLAPDETRSEAFAVNTGPEQRGVRFDQPADLVAIDPSGRRAVAVSQDAAGVINLATARIWNTETGELVEEMPLAQRLHRAALGGDGTRLLLGFRDRLWTLTPSAWRRRVQELEVESDVYETALSADGSLLAAAREGGVLQVWEADGGQPLLYLAGLDPIDALAFSLDGSTLTIAGRTARGIVLRRHPIRATALIDEICNRVTRNLSDAEWAEHVGSGARGRSCPQHP